MKRAMGRICAVALALAMVGCASRQIRTASNAYYSNLDAYEAECVLVPVTGDAVPRCRLWRKVGIETKDLIRKAAQAHARGGSAKPQIAAMKDALKHLKQFEVK